MRLDDRDQKWYLIGASHLFFTLKITDHPRLHMRVSLLVTCLLAAPFVNATAQSPVDPAAYSRLQWRYVGPVGNRVASVAGVVGDPNVYYAGAASGGIWKTVDG